MVIPTELPTANQTAQTDAEVQGNLLREYEQKFAELPEQEKLTRLCSNASFSKAFEKGQFFITLDDDALDSLKGSCREKTLPRSDESSQVEGWIRGNTKIGAVLDVMVCYRPGRYGVEIMIESLFRDRTISWVRIVNGIFSKKKLPKRQKRFLLEVLGKAVQGNLSRRLDHDRHRL